MRRLPSAVGPALAPPCVNRVLTNAAGSTFRRQSGNTFGMSAQCATASVRVAQTAAVERIGANRFTGSFYNAEYAVSGTITITVNGNRLNATLSGGGGSAFFTLSR